MRIKPVNYPEAVQEILEPMKDASGYIMEHRANMAIHLKRSLTSEEHVHHKDGDRLHNDIGNLELWTVGHPPGVRMGDLHGTELGMKVGEYEKMWESGGSYWSSDYYKNNFRRYPWLYMNRSEEDLLRLALKASVSAQGHMIHLHRCLGALQAMYDADPWLEMHISETLRQVIGHDLAHAIRVMSANRGYETHM